jgi:hypothetical protein
VVGLPVASRVEAVPLGLAGGRRDRGYGAQVGPGGLGPQPLGVVPGGDEQDRGGVGADAVQGEQARSMAGDQGPDEVIQALDLAVVNRARRSSGPVTIRARAWLIAWVRSERALRLATISARTASTAPSRPFGAPRARPDWAARAALTASSGSDFP